MNPPFPRKAKPVRKKIRELVEKPKELPETNQLGGPALRFPIKEGLCPWVKLGQTIYDRKLGLTFKEPIARSFWEWWDSCTSAQEAVDTVWGNSR